MTVTRRLNRISVRWALSLWNPVVLIVLVGLNLVLFVDYGNWWSVAAAAITTAVTVYVLHVGRAMRRLRAETAMYRRLTDHLIATGMLAVDEEIRRMYPDGPDGPNRHPRRLP